mgnify:CR=1 FL=1
MNRVKSIVAAARRWWLARLVPDARRVWLYWSTWLEAAGLAILGFVQLEAVGVLSVWNMMPAQVRSILPNHIAEPIAMVLFVAAIVAKFIRQRNLEKR